MYQKIDTKPLNIFFLEYFKVFDEKINFRFIQQMIHVM